MRRALILAMSLLATPALAQPGPIDKPAEAGAAKASPGAASPAACPPAIEVKLPEPPEPPKPDPQTVALADGFFTDLQRGQVGKAYRDIWAGTAMMARKPAEVDAVIAQTASALQLYGRIDRWEPMGFEPVSPSFSKLTYLVAADIGPLFFRLQFYKKPTGWSVYRVDFADQQAQLP